MGIVNIVSPAACHLQCKNDTRSVKWAYVTNKYKGKYAREHDCFCKDNKHDKITSNVGIITGNVHCPSKYLFNMIKTNFSEKITPPGIEPGICRLLVICKSRVRFPVVSFFHRSFP